MPTWALRTDLDEAGLARALPALQAAGLLGLAEDAGGVVAYLPERADAAGLGLDGDRVRWSEVVDRDWSAVWREGLEPVTVGAVTVAPPWARHGDDDVVIDPGQAFGTGHHETTTGCLAALQEVDLAGRRVLDVGTGSGVLAIAAARLGAAEVVGVDTDPVAVATARANVAANAVAVRIEAGSVEAPADGFHVVLANLDTDTVVGLAAGLRARVAPGGVLIVSGVSGERAGEAVAALEEAGQPVLVRPGREWVVLVGRRSG